LWALISAGTDAGVMVGGVVSAGSAYAGIVKNRIAPMITASHSFTQLPN